MPHFSTLIAAEAKRLRGEKGDVPVLNREMKMHISGLLKDFAASGSASDKSLELYVNAEVLLLDTTKLRFATNRFGLAWWNLVFVKSIYAKSRTCSCSVCMTQ